MDDARRLGQGAEFARLDRTESLRLLSTVRVGRLIFTVNALPALRPMNFALVDELILLRTAADSTAARKVDGMIVAFEADELDVAACSGWSVMVTGRAALVTDPDAAARYREVPLVSWAAGVRDRFVTITMELTEGRRVSRPSLVVETGADEVTGDVERRRAAEHSG
jgi:uncharacterized protein